MRSMNIHSHPSFLRQRLLGFLAEGSFARRMWRAIGYEIDSVFSEEREDDGYSALFPCEALFLWISQNGGFDPAWLADEAGGYIDDQGERVPKTVRATVSGVEQLAAYGLWLLDIDMPSIGDAGDDDPWDDQDCNQNGVPYVDALDHRAECLLLAYQALLYAERMAGGRALSPVETAQAVAVVDFVAHGRRGADLRHAKMRELKAYAVGLFQARAWKSPSVAARSLQAEIMKHGRAAGLNLVESNAQRTITAWFKESLRANGSLPRT